MPTIYIAGNRIVPYAPSLENAAFGHLQLVYDGYGGLVELEVQAQRETGDEPAPPGDNPFWGSWRFEQLNEDHTAPENTYNYDVDGYYDSVAIDIGDRSASDVWGIFEQVQNAYLDYYGGNLSTIDYAVNFNSNSWINTLLHVVGLSADDYTGALGLGTTVYDPGLGSAFIETVGFLGYPGSSGNALTGENTPFVAGEHSIPLNLHGYDNADIIRTGMMNDTIDGRGGDDELAGLGGDDILLGGEGNDVLSGGEGADRLDGGAGNDVLYFDGEDVFISGGAGHDIAYAQDTVAVTVDLNETELEVVLGAGGNDTITAYGDGQMVAGGAGDDIIHIERQDTSGPTIVWGGAGADTIRFSYVEDADEWSVGPGILVVNVTDLTEENFHQFDVDMIGLGEDFDWSQIDAVILNADATDSLQVTDYYGEVGTISVDTTTEVQSFSQTTGPDGPVIHQDYGSISYDTFDFAEPGLRVPGNVVTQYNQSFIAGYSGQIYTPADRLEELTIVETRYPPTGDTSVQVYGDEHWHQYMGIPLAEGLGLGGSGWDFEWDYEYDFSSAHAVSSWVEYRHQASEDYLIQTDYREHYFYRINPDPLERALDWFIIGAEMSGTSLVGSDEFTVTIGDPDGAGGDDVLDGLEGADDLSGGGGNDAMNGGGGSDTMSGGSGSDTLNGGAGGDSLNGGSGFDFADYSDATAGVVASLLLPSENNGEAAGDTYTGIEGLIGSDFNDTLTGDERDNSLDAGAGNDELRGGLGNDTLNGGSGNDQLWGDAGFDTLNGGAGGDDLFGGAQADVLHGGEGGDHLEGGDGLDTLFGDEGDDALFGGMGDDQLRGGAGDDVLEGGDGNDRLWGEHGSDRLEGGIGNDTVSGGGLSDEIYGNAGHDHLDGGADDDVLYGGNNNDTVLGGDGHDVLYGDSDNDMLNGGTGDDQINGGGQDDHLFGDEGDDNLYGDGGFDTLNGGAGNDDLTGGFNADTFVFEGRFGHDRITDFAATNDFERIDLSGVVTIEDWADLVSNHMQQSGANVIIDDQMGNSILLAGVNINDLDAADFVF